MMHGWRADAAGIAAAIVVILVGNHVLMHGTWAAAFTQCAVFGVFFGTFTLWNHRRAQVERKRSGQTPTATSSADSSSPR